MMETPLPSDANLPGFAEPAPSGEPGPAPFLDEFSADAGEPEPVSASGLEAVQDVPVKVQAVLGRSRMPIGDLLRLRCGAVVELDRRVGEPVDIFVNNRLIARGEVVMIDNSLGVTLTEIVQAEH